MSKKKILVVGSSGQIGGELVEQLRIKYGREQVVAADIKDLSKEEVSILAPYETLNVMNAKRLLEVVKTYDVGEIYLLAALLSATAEKNPMFAWDLNMQGLFNVLDLAKEGIIQKVYWPSSIAVFGPTTPRQNTPQFTVMEPNTVYGISKLAGERWCDYYFQKYGVDVRSLRYPGLIGYKTAPGGGTTDYAVHIYHEALKSGSYCSFLGQGTILPMMFMEDAINATLGIMETDPTNLKTRSSYNVAGMSFAPEDIAASIQKHLPDFTLLYAPDERQKIANSWPESIDDSVAREHWGWKPQYDLQRMSDEMILQLKKLYVNQ